MEIAFTVYADNTSGQNIDSSFLVALWFQYNVMISDSVTLSSQLRKLIQLILCVWQGMVDWLVCTHGEVIVLCQYLISHSVTLADTDETCPCLILILLSTWLGSKKYKSLV